MTPPKRMIGIDPGLATTGFAIIERAEQPVNRYRAVDYGVIRTASGRPTGARLKHIFDRLGELLKAYRPSAAAVEKVYFGKNVKTAMQVGEARGVMLLALGEWNIPIYDVTPSEVKNNVVGSGKADKKQVQTMVKRIFNLDEIPRPPDAADALAIAVTGMRLAPWQDKIKGSE